MSSSAPEGPKQNRILAALPAEEFLRLENDLEPVKLTVGQTILKSGDTLAHVYFPTTCILSLITITESGSSMELAMTGKDGLIGILLVLGGESSIYNVVVQSAGYAYRLPSDVMRWELEQGGVLRSLSLCNRRSPPTAERGFHCPSWIGPSGWHGVEAGQIIGRSTEPMAK